MKTTGLILLLLLSACFYISTARPQESAKPLLSARYDDMNHWCPQTCSRTGDQQCGPFCECVQDKNTKGHFCIYKGYLGKR
uniref:Uncharacterized protein n=1 Tax=Rhipicephalus appendiculatus TaxID=34631 RepID=A0A131YCQ7_RHIAP